MIGAAAVSARPQASERRESDCSRADSVSFEGGPVSTVGSSLLTFSRRAGPNGSVFRFRCNRSTRQSMKVHQAGALPFIHASVTAAGEGSDVT